MKTQFDKQVSNWTRRKSRMGDGAIGRRDENHVEQGQRIAVYLRRWLGDNFYSHGMDFGCGWGRFSALLAEHCGHLWAVDLFGEWTARAANLAPTITPISLEEPKLPLETRSINLIADIMTLQSIDDDKLMLTFANELKRVAAAGATVISLHCMKSKPTSRTVLHRAKQLGLSDWEETRVDDIDKAKEPYSFLVGVRM